jgi:hypothetical protein
MKFWFGRNREPSKEVFKKPSQLNTPEIDHPATEQASPDASQGVEKPFENDYPNLNAHYDKSQIIYGVINKYQRDPKE